MRSLNKGAVLAFFFLYSSFSNANLEVQLFGNELRWSTQGWMQVQSIPSYESICEGFVEKCLVKQGSYKIINHSTKQVVEKFDVKYATEKTLRNIVIVIADDIGHADLAISSASLSITPNLKKLAKRGIEFQRFYTASAVCSPSRVGIITGQHPANMGIYTTLHASDQSNKIYNSSAGIPDTVPTIYEILKTEGYTTGHFGKWHMGGSTGFGPSSKGVDTHFTYATAPEDKRAEISELYNKGPEAYYGQLDNLLSKEAAKFFEKSSENGSPFIATVAFHAPHSPLHPQEKYLDKFSHYGSTISEGHKNRGFSTRKITPAQVYSAAINQLDDNVGVLIQSLEDAGVMDNTIFLFMGDNGPGTASLPATSLFSYGKTGNFRGNKGTIYNGGLVVPFLISAPGYSGGRTVKQPVSALDIVPTLLSLNGINANYPFDGVDISQTFENENFQRSDPMFWVTVQNKPFTEHVANRSPVLGAYFPESNLNCLMQPDGTRKELYDTRYNVDPGQLNNLELNQSFASDGQQCFTSLENWFVRLPGPKKFRDGAGELYRNR